jgi:hypothetical protein
MKIMYQQGDCIIVAVQNIPETAKLIKTKIVEKGEGMNTHVIEGDCEIYMDRDVMYLKVGNGASLKHEEHGTQVLEPNTVYKKVNEREWDYESEEARKVID